MKSLAVFFVLVIGNTLSHAQSTPELKAQAYDRYEKADKSMNAAYKQLLASLNEEGQKRLRASQRTWIAFRDAQAAFDCHHFAGGKFEGLERTGSMHLLTEARTKRLLADYARFKKINR